MPQTTATHHSSAHQLHYNTKIHCNILQLNATYSDTPTSLEVSTTVPLICAPTALYHTAKHCNTPQHTATRCNALQHTATQHTATHCNTLQHAATHRLLVRPRRTPRLNSLFDITHAPLQCGTVCCSVLQCVAVWCNTLRHTVTHCNTLQHTAKIESHNIHGLCFNRVRRTSGLNELQHTPTHSNPLQHAANQHNTLQINATHCNTLQRSRLLT